MVPPKGCGFPAVLVVKISHSFSHFGLKLGVVLPLSGGQFQLHSRKRPGKKNQILTELWCALVNREPRDQLENQRAIVR